ncbi:FAD-dependent oxidoreductase [Acidocella aquatica]|uniref:FAD-dependent oxidoreductase n=1 Tax=Acidocella aquatica TaxID=1922313 RepID=A0ABQ6A6L5_9PROT|nr:FAD-dependent monooxygenase [Acidocella aquatica]GLR65759.1 FAD-dependent oxidoreductase [Acidocella aquatica]
MSAIVIAGGGLAGAATATLLAQAGREVTLIERESAPAHKICGEFMSTEAQVCLRQLGLDCGALGGARITHVRLIRGKRSITAKLPFEGLGLTRKTLDETLLNHAAQAGVSLQRGHAIRRISFSGGIQVEIDRSPPLTPRTLFLATGKHDTRGAPRAGRASPLIGFKTYFRLNPAQHAALAGHVELYLFPGGYAGMQLVENGEANFCLLVEPALFAHSGGKFPALLEHLQTISPPLAARLAGAQTLLPTPLTIARVPYGFVHRPHAQDPANMFRLGDQAAVIASFTGDGMAIALHSAALAAGHFLRGETSQTYHRRLARDVSGQIRRATALHAALSAPLLGPALFAAARIFPQALAISAAFTRVPEYARL